MDESNSIYNQNFLDVFYQTKQRVDLEVLTKESRVIGKTKMTFKLRSSENSSVIEGNYSLKINAENMFIRSVYVYDSCDNGDEMTDENLNINSISKVCSSSSTNLKYQYMTPDTTSFYLRTLYANIEDIDSFRNLNRVEWETRHEGNLEIFIESKHLKEKIKIVVEYELNEKSIGLVLHNFFDEKLDMEYEVWFTPNFYFNTCNWVPCIYTLKSQILFRLYIIVPKEFSVYCSCQLACVYDDPVNNKRAFFYKSREQVSAKNVGVVIVLDKIFNRVEDPSNSNIFYVINENKRERLDKMMISNGLMSAVYSFYEEFFESDMNTTSGLNSSTFIIFVPYMNIMSFSGKYSKINSAKDENYFNMIKFPNLYILPEKMIYNDSVPDIMEYQLKNIGKLFITNFIGGLITEYNYADFWLICGIENWLSDHFLLKCFGQNYIKNKMNNYIRELKKYSKHGREKRPLYTNSFSHPMELQFDPLVYLKSTVVLHLLEAQVEKSFLQKALKNIINERHKNGYNISTESFIKIFKKNCGINLKHFMQLWIYKTGMLELTISYSYNKRTNSIDLEIYQKPITQEQYEKNPHFKLKDVNVDDKLSKKLAVVDFKARPIRYFDVNVNVFIYQTNGIEIMRESHQVKLETEKESMFVNFPLSAKIRKAPIKKREQEFIQELIANTSIGKIFSNEEIEKILTQNSIMWVKADPDITHIRKVDIPQQHILYEYIKLFKEGDVVGQYESLKNIYRDTPKESLPNSLIILETFIRSTSYYKLRLYGLKVYVKIILQMKCEEGYMFLLEYFEDSLSEVLKNKTQLNRDAYFVLKKIIKYLGNYREDYFNEFFVIGRVTNSSIQNKIIDKFLAILISNDLNIINGFNDSYITREILIGCSKLNLQEKTFFLLKKIVKILRIEKLKRSCNEVVIISAIEAFLNVLVRNDFFSSSFKTETGGNNITNSNGNVNGNRLSYNEKSNNSMIKTIVNEIISEINYYLNSDCETIELKIFLEYVQIYLLFYKSLNFSEFVRSLYSVIFKETEVKENENINMTDINDVQNINTSILNSSSRSDENMLYKILALDILFEQTEFTFDNLNEKLEMINLIKDVLYSRLAYYRIDLRKIAEKLFNKVLNKQIVSQDVTGEKKHFNAANIITINSTNILHNMNKNWLNFIGKKYADEEWLYSFAREERRDTDYLEGAGKVPHSEMSSETQSRYGTKQFSLIKRYQMRYPDDTYAIFNYNLDLEKRPWLECCFLILEKLINHPLAEPFCLPLNQETLGDLHDQYHAVIKHPMDLVTVKEKLNDSSYPNMNEFQRDILLVFSNCRDFNVKGSGLHEYANQLEDFFKILMEPIRKKNLETIFSKEMPEIKIKLQGEDIN